MGRFLREHLYSLAFLLSLLTAVLAENDPNYRPWSNFRPENVTGLTDLYAWVGSYYNATTEIELKPTIGSFPRDPLCPPLQNYTSVSRWGSELVITERGHYNSGSDPVNIFLCLIQPNYNLSRLPAPRDVGRMSPSMWPLVSSQLRWKPDENRTAEDYFDEDYFNFTVTKSRQGAYNLSGTLQNVYYGLASGHVGNITMPACNVTEETDDWEVVMLTSEQSSTVGWADFKSPHLTVLFDDKSANLTMTGVFFAYPSIRTNASEYINPPTFGSGVQGTIQMRFSGALDTYHSDVLNMNSSTPEWLRTVGFGNNTENIGSGADGVSRSRLAVAITAVLFSLAAVYF